MAGGGHMLQRGKMNGVKMVGLVLASLCMDVVYVPLLYIWTYISCASVHTTTTCISSYKKI